MHVYIIIDLDLYIARSRNSKHLNINYDKHTQNYNETKLATFCIDIDCNPAIDTTIF